MGKNAYHDGWEILISDHSRPILASRLIAELRMPEIRDCYVEQASESVANLFEAIGKVLPQLISKALLSGNHSMQAHYSQAGKKLFDDCLLYIASFPTVELQDQAQGLVNDIYGHMFDQLCSS